MAISAADASRPVVVPRERVGILGGMFDPVHLGHLQVAEQLREHLALDEVLLVPCGVPVHRGSARASNAQRCAMLELAARGLPWLHVDRREVDSLEPSWTYTTLRALRAERPDSALFCIMGADAFLGLPTWYHWEELPDFAHLIVSTRPGYTLDPEALNEPLRSFCRRHLAERPQALESQLAGRLYFAPLRTPPLSSTDVREHIRKGANLAGLLPPAVADYVAQQQLYLGNPNPGVSPEGSEHLTSAQLQALTIAALEDLKGQNIVSLDIAKLSTIADYMVVVTGTSNRHVKSLADEVSKRGKEAGLTVRMEGQETGEWILLDLGDVIVHVMQAATRKLYDLESLWKLTPADIGA